MVIKAIERIRETADTDAKGAAAFVELTFKKAGILDAKAKVSDKNTVSVRFKAVATTAIVVLTLENGKVTVDTFDFNLEYALPESNFMILDRMRDSRGLNSTALSKALVKAADHMNELAQGHQELSSLLQRVDRALTALAHAAARNAEGLM